MLIAEAIHRAFSRPIERLWLHAWHRGLGRRPPARRGPSARDVSGNPGRAAVGFAACEDYAERVFRVLHETER